MQILVVDDSLTIRSIVKNILNRIGYENILEAENGLNAFEILKQNSDIQILITDWNMPGMSGLELVQQVRSFKHFSEIKIIMITTEGAKQDVIRAIKSGVNDYIVKPFTPNVLSEKLSRILTS